jgi:hypothetical protein
MVTEPPFSTQRASPKTAHAAGHFEDARLQAAAHRWPRAAAAPRAVVEGPAHPREAVDHQDDLVAAFELDLYVGEDQFGELDVLVGCAVARTGGDFRASGRSRNG